MLHCVRISSVEMNGGMDSSSNVPWGARDGQGGWGLRWSVN